MKVLLVDDDRDLRQTLEVGISLHWPDCEVKAVESGEKALAVLDQEPQDLVLLDIAMAGMTGIEVLQRIRASSDVPVIMLTARTEEMEKVRALGLGADDYVGKPFGALELLARMQAVMRRSDVFLASPSHKPLAFGKLAINFSTRTVSIGGERVDLTPTEFRLLSVLARNAGRALSHDVLLTRAWGREYKGESGFVKVYIKRLRDKLEEDPSNPRYILTERGHGYKFAMERTDL